MDPQRRPRGLPPSRRDDLFAQLVAGQQMFGIRPNAGNRVRGLFNAARPLQPNAAVPVFPAPMLRFGQQPADFPWGAGRTNDINFIKSRICGIVAHNGKERSFGYTGISGQPGVCIAEVELVEEENFFEVEIKGRGHGGEEMRIGVATMDQPMDKHVGSCEDSISYSVFDGKGYFGKPDRTVYSPAKVNDRIGIALHLDRVECIDEEAGKEVCPLSVIVNGKEILQQDIVLPQKPFYPAFSLGGRGQSLRFIGLSHWSGQEEDMLIDDNGEENVWRRINHVTINGQLLTYTGRGEDFSEFGMAQGRKPLRPANHYFEVEIIDPGRCCYVALGVTRKDYPSNMHPGWDRGSIAYHADDGKIFTGHGIGNPFGPKCHKGDIMGCGIMFPRDYQADSDDESDADDGVVDQWAPGKANPNRLEGPGHFGHDNFAVDIYDFPEDDELWSDEEREEIDDVQRRKVDKMKVQVFFTRNGTTIGRRENVTLPPGGFYPTVGMLSPDEKVRVDLQPLSG